MGRRRARDLSERAQRLRPSVHVGKGGLSSSVLDELERQLKKNKLVKIRLLQSVEGDRDAIAGELAARTSSAVVETRGRTVVLARKRPDQI